LAGADTPVLLGPTGIGKTAVAFALAAHWPIEVVSADSRQIYKGLAISTAKPPRRWLARVPHHGLDLVAPGERYSAGRFAQDAPHWIAGIIARGHRPVVVGGTGLYVKALVDGLFLEPPLDPDRRQALARWVADLAPIDLVRWAGRLDRGFRGGGRQRASRALEVALLTGQPLGYWQARAREQGVIRPWYVVLTAPRAIVHQRLRTRAETMVSQGMIEEVAAVLAEGGRPGTPGLDAIGPREAVEYLQGLRSRESVAEAVAVASRQYAKRQETWFRHQLDGPVLMLDATRPPEELAADIARRWAEVTSRQGSEATRRPGLR
jgi:tRNA dimethylallyltransferase